jgi:outer membrane protein OmpA-like peptidoglycan-associated protein
MKDRPTMIIELGGHTDRRGSADYNLRLSKERAQIAKDYLVKKGISADRIRTKGYGETQLEVSDEEISAMKSRKEREAAHQLNRRTIVKVISE